MLVKSIDSHQAAKVGAIMALLMVLLATYPVAAAAYLFSVRIPREHYMILLFVPFFFAAAMYFLVGFGCRLFNFSARHLGGVRIDAVYDEEVETRPALKRRA